MSKIISDLYGCDFVIDLGEKRNKIKLLQLTDMQVIDSSQRRTPERLRPDEIKAWAPENFDALCGNHIRSLVSQTKPDLIFITGDIVYGSFDDKGSTLKWFCKFMDSLEIPWAPVFGNHDNESKMGVAWQCEQFEKSKYCVFKRGEVFGNGNYTVGILSEGKLVRALHMTDSNGCAAGDDKDVIKAEIICPDQIELIKKKTQLIQSKCNAKIPAFLAFHIPTKEFEEAEKYNGYITDSRKFYTIGVDAEQKNGDFGFKLEDYESIKTPADFIDTLKECNIDGVFTGHCHNICTCIEYENIRWVFGLKTGQYDYHIPGQIGATLVTLDGKDFDVLHVPSLVAYGPFPGKAKMFNNFFA